MAMLDEDEIKRRAYRIWENEGRPEGREFQNYMDAVAELMAESDTVQDSPGMGASGLSTNLQSGGMAPVGGAPTIGSIGTGGAATGNRATGSARGKQAE
ncbi:DUF2934 domain-containing protein [Devosia submarina]|uniref:DUF2934 domain-containing protein n=1 Tax=Devosia submarina TaxID=1173082 RepID=UPI001FE7FAAB|nr:DUF2934 domain-containing protein [Devosia submarina]